MKYDLCIFDLDGTLVDTRADITTAVNKMLSHYGLETRSIGEVTGYVGDGVKHLVSRCIASHEINFDEALSLFNDAYASHLLDTTRPYPGVYEVLDRLQGTRKALLTNKPRSFTETIIDGLELTHYFESLVFGDTLSRRKPSPEVVEHILSETGVIRDRVIMVGDGKNDILTAKAAGINSVYASYGYSDIYGLLDLVPDFVIHSITELVPICCGDNC